MTSEMGQKATAELVARSVRFVPFADMAKRACRRKRVFRPSQIGIFFARIAVPWRSVIVVLP